MKNSVSHKSVAINGSGATYRPSFVPPTPVTAVKKEIPKADVSSVKVGVIVKHKAFGDGVVKSIDNSLITVEFGGIDKKFQFPGAFDQGFLKI